jgi:hypothetical protein
MCPTWAPFRGRLDAPPSRDGRLRSGWGFEDDAIWFGDEIKVGLDLVNIRLRRVDDGDYRWLDPDPQWATAGGFEWLFEARFNDKGERDPRREGWQVMLRTPGAQEEWHNLSWGWNTLADLRQGRWLGDVRNRDLTPHAFVTESFMSAFLAEGSIDAAVQHARSNPLLLAVRTADFIKLALET